MKKKEFKSESKRILDLMINSIYTNKEIFLRELLSNASDALDKLYYTSLTNQNIKVNKDDLSISVELDKEGRIITISDNGIGMNEEELESNLGTIARSGSLAFKNAKDNNIKETDIIGQFGVGFYSSFMVSSLVEVISRAYNEKTGSLWKSNGESGYTIESTDKKDMGTIIKLHLKDDNADENYSEYLEVSKIKDMIKKYSDYIKYPIIIKDDEDNKDNKPVNSMTPIWKKDKKDIKKDEINSFYKDKYYDYEDPIITIKYNAEGLASFNSLMFIPSHAPFDLYTKEYKKGLSLYTSGVLIEDKCEELLPDYYGFVKGIVDTDDLSLNISRETLQSNKKVKLIASSLETKIKKELLDLMKKDYEKYKKFFKSFGMQLKFGVYNNYGVDKDKLKDLLIFYSNKNKDFITLKSYVEQMEDKQESIYYACGETIDKIDMLPQGDAIKSKNMDILYLTDYMDEFVLQALVDYEGKNFKNVASASLNIESDEDNNAIKKVNEDSKEILKFMKEALKDNVFDVKFTNKLVNHPVCLTTEGNISVEMQKVINAMPNDEKINAQVILEINEKHAIVDKIKDLYKTDKEKLKSYTKVLYSQARLIEGLQIDNPTEISNIICDLIS
ncbi:MAG: molecular chaperone HtpG [Bacilli bacterium]